MAETRSSPGMRERVAGACIPGRSLTSGVVVVVGLALLSSCGSSKATVSEVWILEGGRVLDVIIDTCNADLEVDVDESPDSITIVARRKDGNLFGTGDDCQDAVRVQLEDEVGTRKIWTANERELPVITTATADSSAP